MSGDLLITAKEKMLFNEEENGLEKLMDFH